MIEILGMLMAGAGASWGFWQLQRRRNARVAMKALESAFDTDAQVVFSVAGHAMTSRGHLAMWPVHLLYGLLQDESFIGLVKQMGGDPDAIETTVLDLLDKAVEPPNGQRQLVELINRSYHFAHQAKRKITVTDLAARLLVTDIAPVLAVASPAKSFDSFKLFFRLVHGMDAPPPELPGRTDVAVVLRNDDHTPFEFVMAILQNVFDLSPADAETRTMETHNAGRTIVGRLKLPVAKDKVITARSRAREQNFPLWIGLEDC